MRQAIVPASILLGRRDMKPAISVSDGLLCECFPPYELPEESGMPSNTDPSQTIRLEIKL